jgi:hypothetical protein
VLGRSARAGWRRAGERWRLRWESPWHIGAPLDPAFQPFRWIGAMDLGAALRQECLTGKHFDGCHASGPPAPALVAVADRRHCTTACGHASPSGLGLAGTDPMPSTSRRSSLFAPNLMRIAMEMQLFWRGFTQGASRQTYGQSPSIGRSGNTRSSTSAESRETWFFETPSSPWSEARH